MHYAELKKTAVALRQDGQTYTEILRQVPVAKSTLALWLQEVGLSYRQRQRITEKRLQAALRGAQNKRAKRVSLTENIVKEAKAEIGSVSRRELFLFGVALYWAEGAKAKENNVSAGVRFVNSDPIMVRIFLKWLKEICNIESERIDLEIYIHENSQNILSEVIQYWSKATGFPIDRFTKIYFKRNKVRRKSYRQNIGKGYYGILSVRVKRSSELNRKILGWISGIHWGVV